jgi:hypothetical protein
VSKRPLSNTPNAVRGRERRLAAAAVLGNGIDEPPLRHKGKICAIDGCGKPRRKREWCNAHYHKMRLHGNPIGKIASPGENLAFIEKAVGYDGDECLLWPFSDSSSSDKRGVLHMDSRKRRPSRIVCERTKGANPQDKPHCLHSCGNGDIGCCTPKHLRWGTHTENMADKKLDGTERFGSRNHFTKLNDADVIEIRRLGRTLTYDQIAKIFCVGKKYIRDIVNNKARRAVIAA